MIVTHGKIYERCAACGKLVQINKLIFGSLHVCSERGERQWLRSEDVPRPITILGKSRLLGRDLGVRLSDEESAYLTSLRLAQCDECCVAFRTRDVVKNPRECFEKGDEDFYLCRECIPDVVERMKRQKQKHPEWYAKS